VTGRANREETAMTDNLTKALIDVDGEKIYTLAREPAGTVAGLATWI
jgi:hypothetical protein